MLFTPDEVRAACWDAAEYISEAYDGEERRSRLERLRSLATRPEPLARVLGIDYTLSTALLESSRLPVIEIPEAELDEALLESVLLEKGFTGRVKINTAKGGYYRCYAGGKIVSCASQKDHTGKTKHERTHDWVKKAFEGGIQHSHISRLRKKLERMTLGEIRELKRALGVSASGSRADLIGKIAARTFKTLADARKADAAAMGPHQQQPTGARPKNAPQYSERPPEEAKQEPAPAETQATQEPAAEKPAEAPEQPKEAWQIPRSQWTGSKFDHAVKVRLAIANGKDVPPEVLADYPNLTKPTTPPPVAPMAPVSDFSGVDTNGKRWSNGLQADPSDTDKDPALKARKDEVNKKVREAIEQARQASPPRIERDASVSIWGTNKSYKIVRVDGKYVTVRPDNMSYRQWQAYQADRSKYEKQVPIDHVFDWKQGQALLAARDAYNHADRGEFDKALQAIGELTAKTGGKAAAGKTDTAPTSDTTGKSDDAPFTGTDSQGRQWVNGELVAAKDEPAGGKEAGGQDSKGADSPTQTIDKDSPTSYSSGSGEQQTSTGANPVADTPRATAQAADDGAYEFARKSTVGNFGEDLKGSARHLAAAWRGLDEAEKDGTAQRMVNRENLLKAEPHNLMATITPQSALAHLAAHFALNAFPAKAGDEKQVQAYLQNAKNEPGRKTAEELRRQYYDAFQAVKAEAEKAASEAKHPLDVNQRVRAVVKKLIDQYRGSPPGMTGSMAVAMAKDPYNPIVNVLIPFHNSLLVSSRPKANTVQARVDDFASRLQAKYGDINSPQAQEQAVQHASDVMEGDSLNKTFGEAGKGAVRFDPTKAYVGTAERKGGRMIDTSSVEASRKHMMENVGLRGVQWGNYVTDDERAHHLSKSAEAFADLADVLDLPDSAISLGGKIGLAIGARGKGGALAHYEPDTQVINLTRAKGVGSLAHEWAHAMDHYLEDFSGGKDGTFASQKMGKGPIASAMSGVRLAIKDSGFVKRLSGVVSEMIRDGELPKNAWNYWASHEELFARTFERFVQKKLHDQGRENTYLVGLHKEIPALWPNAEEMASIAPALDRLVDSIRQHKNPARG